MSDIDKVAAALSIAHDGRPLEVRSDVVQRYFRQLAQGAIDALQLAREWALITDDDEAVQEFFSAAEMAAAREDYTSRWKPHTRLVSPWKEST